MPARHLAFLYALTFVVLIVLSGCGNDDSSTSNPAITPMSSTSGSVSVKRFGTGKVLDKNSSVGLEVANRPECRVNGARSNFKIDSRLVPGTKLSIDIKSAHAGLGAATYHKDETILSNDGQKLTESGVFSLNGHSVTSQKECDIPGPGGIQLLCHGVGEKVGPSPFSTAEVRSKKCEAVWLKDSIRNVVTQSGDYTFPSGLKVNFTSQTTSIPSNIVCNHQIVAKGMSVETRVFSFDIPSYNKDSCFAGTLLNRYSLQDLKGNEYFFKEESLEDFQFPQKAAVQSTALSPALTTDSTHGK